MDRDFRAIVRRGFVVGDIVPRRRSARTIARRCPYRGL